MINLLKAEKLKYKGTAIHLLLWVFPVMAFGMTAILLTPDYVQQSSYNWWYILLLPALLTSMVAFTLDQDRKKNWHGLMGIFQDKSEIWMGKIGYYCIVTMKTILVFLAINLLSTFLFPQKISLAENVLASIILYIGFIWQIPVIMFLTLKSGKIPALIISMMFNIILPATFSTSNLWMIPYAIPARLMIPLIDVLPNGLLNNGQGVLANSSVIFPGISICIVLFVLLSLITIKYFKKVES